MMRISPYAIVSLIAILTACTGLSAREDGGPASTPSVSDRQAPNVIMIVADDLGYGDVAFNGGTDIPTPHLNALAASGVIFSNGYVTAAVCAPSRAGLFTARYQQSFGYEFNPRGRDRQGVGIPPEVVTVPERFRRAGYKTAMIGKWHLGRTPEVHPLGKGFDTFFGFAAGGNGYLAKLEPGDLSFDDPVPGSRRGMKRMRLERGFEAFEPEEGYLTDILTDEAVAYIEDQGDEPFFLALTHFAPHTPLQATKRYLDRFTHIEDPQKRTYAAMVSALDDGVGAVMDALERKGMLDNTLVMFLSDNGCAAYIGEGRCSNEPLSGSKGSYFEGGIRVPMIMSWPGVVPEGTTFDHTVASLDLSVTALTAAAIDLSDAGLDGYDLLPFVTGEEDGAPRAAMLWRTQPNYTIRKGDWKLLVIEIVGGGEYVALFNLAEDPAEQNNLAAEKPEKVAALTAAFEEWSSSLPEPSFDSQRKAKVTLPDGTRVQLYN